jgi:hypothetical protein
MWFFDNTLKALWNSHPILQNDNLHGELRENFLFGFVGLVIDQMTNNEGLRDPIAWEMSFESKTYMAKRFEQQEILKSPPKKRGFGVCHLTLSYRTPEEDGGESRQKIVYVNEIATGTTPEPHHISLAGRRLQAESAFELQGQSFYFRGSMKRGAAFGVDDYNFSQGAVNDDELVLINVTSDKGLHKMLRDQYKAGGHRRVAGELEVMLGNTPSQMDG